MEIVPWKPFRELSGLRKEMDSLWERFFNDSPLERFVSQRWSPSVDISETKGKIIVKAELPGLAAKNISVTLTDSLLTIKGEKKEESEEKDATRHVVERYHGIFERSFRLPAEVNDKKVEAVFDKGVLTVTLPKLAPSKKKEIDVKG